MSRKSASPITEPNIPNSLRCIFTNNRKERCSNPHHGSATGICIFHERYLQKEKDDEAKSISEELLNGGEALGTKQQLNHSMSKLFQLIAQKRIGRHDGILLAYIGSLLLQTIDPSRTPGCTAAEATAYIRNIFKDTPPPNRENRFNETPETDSQEEETNQTHALRR